MERETGRRERCTFLLIFWDSLRLKRHSSRRLTLIGRINLCTRGTVRAPAPFAVKRSFRPLRATKWYGWRVSTKPSAKVTTNGSYCTCSISVSHLKLCVTDPCINLERMCHKQSAKRVHVSTKPRDAALVFAYDREEAFCGCVCGDN